MKDSKEKDLLNTAPEADTSVGTAADVEEHVRLYVQDVRVIPL